jgi:hypothetical protein
MVIPAQTKGHADAISQAVLHNKPGPAMNHPILSVLWTCSFQRSQRTHRTARDDGMKFAMLMYTVYPRSGTTLT